MTEQEMRKRISRLKLREFTHHYEIVCDFISNNQELKQGKLFKVEVDNEKKQFILTFIES